MTREEAINYLQPIADSASLPRYAEALDVAIAALRERETVTDIHQFKTNADHIRSMTDEELAGMLWKTGRNYRVLRSDPVKDFEAQTAALVIWLKTAYKEA